MSVWILDGARVDSGDRAWASLQPAMRVGDGVFRTMRAAGGRVLWRDAQLDALRAAIDAAGYDRAGVSIRLERTLAAVDTALGEPAWSDGAAVRLFATPRADNYGRALLTPLSVWASIEALRTPEPDMYRAGVMLGDSHVPHPGLGLLGKTCGYAWARTAMRWAYREKVDDAALARDGVVVEAASAALVWREAEQWLAVDPRHGATPSVTQRVFSDAVGGLALASPTPSRIEAADQVVLLSSLRLAVGVRSYRARVWPTPDAGLDAIRALWLMPQA